MYGILPEALYGCMFVACFPKIKLCPAVDEVVKPTVHIFEDHSRDQAKGVLKRMARDPMILRVLVFMGQARLLHASH